MERMKLQSKKSKSAIGESAPSTSTVTQDNTNIGSNQKQKAISAKPESDTRFNIKPVKVVLKKLSDKQILSAVKSSKPSSIKKESVIPRNTTRQARDIHTPAIL